MMQNVNWKLIKGKTQFTKYVEVRTGKLLHDKCDCNVHFYIYVYKNSRTLRCQLLGIPS